MPTEMKDKDKGGEDRVSKLEKEQQEKINRSKVKEVGEYPEAEGDTDQDVPPGT